jgi:hypothetical protein
VSLTLHFTIPSDAHILVPADDTTVCHCIEQGVQGRSYLLGSPYNPSPN